MMLSLLMLAQAATAAPPPPAQKAPPTTVTEGANYPVEAVREGMEGTVRADLTVTAAGTVSACKIVQSTGHRLLDEFTCKNLMRAKFTAAKDDNGNPVESHYLTPPIVFKLTH